MWNKHLQTPLSSPPASKISSPSLASQEPGLNVHYQTFCTLNQNYPLFKTHLKKKKL